MCLVGLELPAHDDSLLQEVGQASHYDWVEHVDLEVEAVPNMEAIEGHALDEGDAGHKPLRLAVLIPAVADGQGTVNRHVQPVDVLGDCISCEKLLLLRKRDQDGFRSPVGLSKGPRYST